MKINNNFVKILLCTILFIFLCTSFKAPNIIAAEKNKEVKKILIDPGHGGIDGGAVSRNGTVEKDINLSISLMLREELKNKGYEVMMTRDDDRGLYTDSGKIRKKKIEDLNNRCKIKNESGCDIFISIHLNMFPESKYYGAQVWYASSKDSESLAHILQVNLKQDLDINNNRIEKPANDSYKILRCNQDMASVIVECGFLSNPAEESKLKSDEYQQKIAQSIANSVKQYFEEN